MHKIEEIASELFLLARLRVLNFFCLRYCGSWAFLVCAIAGTCSDSFVIGSDTGSRTRILALRGWKNDAFIKGKDRILWMIALDLHSYFK